VGRIRSRSNGERWRDWKALPSLKYRWVASQPPAERLGGMPKRKQTLDRKRKAAASVRREAGGCLVPKRKSSQNGRLKGTRGNRVADHLAACSNGAGEWGAGVGIKRRVPSDATCDSNTQCERIREDSLSVRSDSMPFVLRAAGMECDASSLVNTSTNGQGTTVVSAGTS
jgi:hypothetical protein